MRSYIVIPARLESTRLAQKLLLSDTGKSVLQHTYEAARRAERPEAVWVAADSAKLVDHVRSFGGQAELTDSNARTGTDRVAELAKQLPAVDLIVNVQGDEPELSGGAIDQAIGLLEENNDVVMSTLATPIRSRQQWEDPACVKVVCDDQGRALYFSRSPIPHPRRWDDQLLVQSPPVFLQHVGLYAYRREFLLEFASLPPSYLEQVEQLEQLRVLTAGRSIQVGVIDEPSTGIDTAEDYRAFVERYQARRI